MAGKDIRPGLVANFKLVAQPLADKQNGGFALTLKQRISRNGCPHSDRGNGGRLLSAMLILETFDPLNSGIRILSGIFRQQLIGQDLLIGCKSDNISEGTAPVDPELPVRLLRRACHYPLLPVSQYKQRG